MDLAAYLRLLRRRLAVVLVCVVAGVGGGLFVGHASTVKYQATAQSLVNIPAARGVQEALAGAQLSAGFLSTYARIATSRTLAQSVVDSLHLDMTAQDLQDELAATSVKETFLINITVTDTDPKRAAVVADTVAIALGERVDALEKGKPDPVQAEIIDRATVPTRPVSPRPLLDLAVGLLLGLLAGVGAAVLIESLDRTVKSPEQSEAAFGAPLLAVVPRRRIEGGLVSPTTPDSEPYRTLRTALRFLDPDHPVRTLVVTSATAGEGKTTTAANLAYSMALGGERVVLLDCDLRRAGLSESFGLEGTPGLSNVVSGQLPLRAALHEVAAGMVLLTAGATPPNPAEILGSQVMVRLIEQLAAAYDVVVLDTPPVLAVTDAAVLSTQADAVVLVGRSGSLQRMAAQTTRARLDSVGAHVVGHVLNAAPRRELQAYYGDYGYGYGYERDREGARRATRGAGAPARPAPTGRRDGSSAPASREADPAGERPPVGGRR